jgi:predicted GIY-YIG superfamily endonuclease
MRSTKNSKKEARAKAAGSRVKSIYKKPWWVYILECGDKTLYVGIARDVLKRLHTHNTGNTCKYTRCRKPLVVMYQEKCRNHAAAMRRERELKSFNRNEKLQIIEQYSATVTA